MKRIFLFSMLIVSSLFINTPEAIGQTNSVAYAGVTPPASPTGLFVDISQSTSSSLFLRWNDNSTDEVGFEITVDFSYKITVPANTTSFAVTGLNPEQNYNFSIHSYKMDGATMVKSSMASGPAIAQTLRFNPASPSGLFVETSQSTSSSLVLHWNDNSNDEDGFEITIDYGRTVIVPANTRSWTVTGLNPAQTYNFYIYSFKMSGANMVRSLYQSGPVVAQTLKSHPILPGTLRAGIICSNSVELLWTDSDNEELYAIEQAYDAPKDFGQIDLRSANADYFVDTKVQPGRLIYYRIKAINNGGKTFTYSAPIAVYTKQLEPALPPHNVQVTDKGLTSISIQWQNGIEDQVCKVNARREVRVWVSEDDGTASLPVGLAAMLNPDNYRYTITGLKSGTKYKISVQSIGLSNGDSYKTLPIVVATFGPAKPPTDLVSNTGVSIGGNPYIGLIWKDNSDNEDAFGIEVSTDQNNWVLADKVAANVNYFVHMPVNEGVIYYYRAFTYNGFGESGRSAIAAAIVDYTAIPNAPYDLKGKVDEGKVMLTWKDDSSREEMFEVERSDDGATFAKVGTAPRNKGMFMDSTVVAGKSYHYQVRAINPKGNSGYTNKVTLTIPSASTSILTESEVAVFPNPTVNSIVVTLPEAMRNEGGVVTIYDQNNRVMNSTKFAKGEVEKSFNLSAMPQGMYLITISTETTKTSKKVFKN